MFDCRRFSNIVLNKNNIESLEKLHFNVIILISNIISQIPSTAEEEV